MTLNLMAETGRRLTLSPHTGFCLHPISDGRQTARELAPLQTRVTVHRMAALSGRAAPLSAIQQYGRNISDTVEKIPIQIFWIFYYNFTTKQDIKIIF